MFGAERIVLYNHTSGTNLDRFLLYYQSLGLLDIIPWHVPVTVNVDPPDPMVVPEVHYFAQVTALNDCLYRYMYRSRYIVYLDLDELLVPRQSDNWESMLSSLPKDVGHRTFDGGGVTGAYIFQNVFFRIDWEDGPHSTDKRVAQFHLRSQMKTWRETRIWPPHMRSKYIIDPVTVDTVGIHFVFNFVNPKYSHYEVRPSLGLLHHYRDWGDEQPPPSRHQDFHMVQWKSQIISRVMKVHASVNKV